MAALLEVVYAARKTNPDDVEAKEQFLWQCECSCVNIVIPFVSL
jgi:hypothetical protein